MDKNKNDVGKSLLEVKLGYVPTVVPLYKLFKFVKIGRQTNLTEQTHFILLGHLQIMKINFCIFLKFKATRFPMHAHYFVLWIFPSISSLEKKVKRYLVWQLHNFFGKSLKTYNYYDINIYTHWHTHRMLILCNMQINYASGF